MANIDWQQDSGIGGQSFAKLRDTTLEEYRPFALGLCYHRGTAEITAQYSAQNFLNKQRTYEGIEVGDEYTLAHCWINPKYPERPQLDLTTPHALRCSFSCDAASALVALRLMDQYGAVPYNEALGRNLLEVVWQHGSFDEVILAFNSRYPMKFWPWENYLKRSTVYMGMGVWHLACVASWATLTWDPIETLGNLVEHDDGSPI